MSQKWHNNWSDWRDKFMEPILWVGVFCLFIVPSIIAAKKGRGVVLFILISLILWPLALVLALASDDYTKKVRRRLRLKVRSVDSKDVDRFPCPECGERIATSAKSCRFCNAIITEKDKAVAPPAPKKMLHFRRRRS